MGALSGIYDSDWIQPVARIKENLSVWTFGKWAHFIVEYCEPIPPGPASTVDMIVQAGVTTLAAGGTIAKRVVTILQLSENEMLHLRWEPLDNIEGVLWEQSGTAKFNSNNIQSRVNRLTRDWDPHLVSTTFWIMGYNRDMNLEVRNPMQYAIPTARFLFWGYRMVLKPWIFDHIPDDIRGRERLKLFDGDLEAVKKWIGATTWLPAEGRG